MNAEVLIHRLDPELPLPTFARPGDAGADLCSRIDVVIEPGARSLVPTGVAIALPTGFVAIVTPRSGFALKYGGTLLNSPGIIDAGYRGEIGAIVHNSGDQPLDIRRGDRIAQLVVLELPLVTFTEVSALPGSQRADGGFGSSGTRV